MPRKNSAHEIVVESITEALLLLMEKKPLKDISISELCAKAGVVRMSFYRNFSSPEDILVKHFEMVIDKWWGEITSSPLIGDSSIFWNSLFEALKKENRFIDLLYTHNLAHIVRDRIFSSVKVSDHATDSYVRALIAGMIYGVIDEWILRGMRDTPNVIDLSRLITFARENALIIN